MQVNDPRRPGFTLIELLVVISIIALLVSILAPALACMRTEGRRAVCHSNLKTLGTAFVNYSSEYQDRCASFSWKAGEPNPLGMPNSPSQAAADQAVHIFRTRADRPEFGRIGGWIPHVMYSHLVLNDYLEQRLPEPAMACPEDGLRLAWQKDPRNFLTLFQPGVERPGGVSGSGSRGQRWPYSSSYQLSGAAWAPDSRIGDRTTSSQHGLIHRAYQVSELPLGNRKFADVQFPSDKMAWHDNVDRHRCGGTPVYFMHPTAAAPIAFFDGHVAAKKTRDANRGFRPNQPGSPSPSLISYEPEGWEAPTTTGSEAEVLFGVYRWTRGGVQGRDFNGSEIDTSGW